MGFQEKYSLQASYIAWYMSRSTRTSLHFNIRGVTLSRTPCNPEALKLFQRFFETNGKPIDQVVWIWKKLVTAYYIQDKGLVGSLHASFRLEDEEAFLPSPMIAPPSNPSNTTHGPPLEPFHREALTPKTVRLSLASALSSVPGAKLFICGFVTTSRSIGSACSIVSAFKSHEIQERLTKNADCWRVFCNWIAASSLILLTSPSYIFPL